MLHWFDLSCGCIGAHLFCIFHLHLLDHNSGSVCPALDSMTNILCWQAYAETSRSQWVKDWPGQVVLCTSQIYWTLEVHEAIQAGPNVGLFIITLYFVL